MVPTHRWVPAYDPLRGDPARGVPRYSVTNAQLTPDGCCWGGSGTPAGLAYDSGDSAFWVATSADTVAVVPASDPDEVTASVPVGSQPFGVAADPTDDWVFVTNTGSNNVSVLSDSSLLALVSIGVGSSPMGIADDPTDGEVFVANQGSNNVSVISTATLAVVASVNVGLEPLGVVYDPATGRVFVADEGSDMVQAISPTTHTVVANITVGDGPYGIAVDNATDDLYITNSGSGNVSVVNATTGADVADIAIGGLPYSLDLAGIAYDGDTHQVWVGAGLTYLVVLNTSSEAVEWVYTWDPTGVAYDPVDGLICLTNTANATFECLSWAVSQDVDVVNFQETGLPAGAYWDVDTDAGVAGSPTPQISVGVCCESTAPFSYTIGPVGSYVATPSNGSPDIVARETDISVVFSAAATYAVRFNETGLPYGALWSAVLEGITQYSTSSTVTFSEPDGTYAFTLGGVAGWTTANYSGSLTVAGADVTETVPWTQVTYPVVLWESGLPAGTEWSGTINGRTDASSTAHLNFQEPNGTFLFTPGLVPGWTTTPSRDTVVIDGGPVNQTIAWIRVVYAVTFTESGLPSDATWAATLNGTEETAVAASIGFSEPNGSYAFTVTAPDGYSPTVASGVVLVDGLAASEPIGFASTIAPLTANFSWRINYATCLSNGGVTNSVTLYANASGGAPPYTYAWTLPTGSASGSVVDTVLTYGSNNTVVLEVTDSVGAFASHSVSPPMQLPPCPPPVQQTEVSASSVEVVALLILAAGVIVASVAVLLFVSRKPRP